MKKTNKFLLSLSYTVLAFCLISIIHAQSPTRFNYQAVILDSAGTTIKNKTIGVRISILTGNTTGPEVYSETHTPTTDAHGLISLEIGTGNVENGNLTAINWSANDYFIKTETDTEGGNNYSLTGISQLLSVPYALYAEKSGSNIQGPEGDAGKKGEDGDDGQTAYQIWLSAGNTGTEADFLKSLTGPPGNPGSGNSFSHELGEEYGGGVIFHLWRDTDGTEHGLIVSKEELYFNPQDPLEGIKWSNVINTEIGAPAQSSWDGVANTNAIKNQAGNNSGAVNLCLDYASGGFSDWYLPSITELQLVWTNRFHVNKTLDNITGAKRISTNATYWSSTEYNTTKAYYIFFFNGLQDYSQNKGTGFKVRAVRRY